jgi:hypothetical protein
LLLLLVILCGFAKCSKEQTLADIYPKKIKALFMGVERASIKGKFSKGGFKKIVELFKETDFQKHKERVMEKINELKGAFAETIEIASKALKAYNSEADALKIFDFYQIEGLSFKDVPYMLDIPAGGIDRSFSRVSDKITSNLVVEIRPVNFIYRESGDKRSFEADIKIIIFDLKAQKIAWEKTVNVETKIDKPFYTEEKLKPGERPTPGFEKIKVKFFIENYKDAVKNLAEKAAPEIIKYLLKKKRG